MKLHADVSPETTRMMRYIMVRLMSRCGDAVIYGVALTLFGIEWLIPAFIVSCVYNCTFDFLGQKLWAFNRSIKSPAILLREFGSYLAVRSGNFALTAMLWCVLYYLLGFGLIAASIIAIFVGWMLAFSFYRLLFIGSFGNRYPTLDEIRTLLRIKVRSA